MDLVIGSGKSAITVPVSTAIPPTKSGDFKFQYGPIEVTDPDLQTIDIVDFISWAATSFGISLSPGDFPTSLQALTIGLVLFKLDMSTGTVEVEVAVGSKQTGKQPPFLDSWQPITGFPIVFQSLRFDVARS